MGLTLDSRFPPHFQMSILRTSPFARGLIALALLAPVADAGTAAGQPAESRIRVLLDTDANNELDDQHAIAYMLFNGRVFDVEGITVNRTRAGGDVAQHYAEAERVVRLANLHGRVPLRLGANGSFREIEGRLDRPDYDGAAAVRFIIERAHAADPRPLVLLPVGKLTNIALALKKDPSISRKVRVVWLGSNYPERGEYNLENDPESLAYILEQTDVPFEIVTVRYGKPSGTDAVRVTREEIRAKMPGKGPRVSPPVTGREGGTHATFGDYSVALFERIELHGTPPSRALFDMAAVAIVKNPAWAAARRIPAPRLEGTGWVDRPGHPRTVIVWENFDGAAIMRDFYASMERFELARPGGGPPPLRGIYGGVPQEILDSGRRLRDFGIDAVWLGAGSVTRERMALLRAENVQVYAEFNTLHVADYLEEHPDAAPIGADGKVSPPPHGWQGICPTHEAYRRFRMDAFRKLLQDFAIDGVWLDYHHSHASWERADPDMPDTCFCDRCLRRFQDVTGIRLPDAPTHERAALLLSTHRTAWVRWRLDVFTDWVREFRAIVDAARPSALLGTFHNAWSDGDLDGARLERLAIDLKAQGAYIDVFSPMVYHARFGHAGDPAWISRQVTWLGAYLGITGAPGERRRIWPIVQISDWGERVPVEQVATVLDHGGRPPASGVIVFAWGGLRKEPRKIEAIGRAFRSIR